MAEVAPHTPGNRRLFTSILWIDWVGSPLSTDKTPPGAPPNTMDGFIDDLFLESAVRTLRTHIVGLAEGPQRLAQPIVLFSLPTNAIREPGPSESQFLLPYTPIILLSLPAHPDRAVSAFALWL